MRATPATLLLLPLALLLPPAVCRAGDDRATERRQLQAALYAGDAETIHAALRPERLATVAKDHAELLRLVQYATDAMPRYRLQSGKPADWEQLTERLVAAVGGLRDWEKEPFPQGNRLLVWAKEEVAAFQCFLDQRRGTLEEKLCFVAPIREISKSEPGGMDSIRCYLRAFELHLRALHQPGANRFGAVGCAIRARDLEGHVEVAAAKGRTFAIEVLEYGDLGETPPDVALFLRSFTPPD
jgi:hypothetical protein